MFADSGLKRADRETVAVVVSVINGCTYCAERHVATLLELNKDADLVSQIQSDFHLAPVDPRTLAMLRFAEKLTRFPESGYREDVASLRQHGLSDVEILDLALVVAYFNFIARIASGLGVET